MRKISAATSDSRDSSTNKLFLRNFGAICSRIDPIYPFILLAWFGDELKSGRRYDLKREGLFTIGETHGNGMAIKKGIILPVALCTDELIKEQIYSLVEWLKLHSATTNVRQIRRQVRHKADSAGMSWLGIEKESDINGFVGLEPCRELFGALHTYFPMIAEISDRAEQDLVITKTKPLPWENRGELMEWMSAVGEKEFWNDVKVHPFLVFQSAENWLPKWAAPWKSPSVETWNSKTAELLACNSHAPISDFTAKFIIEEYGWAILRIAIDNLEYEARLTCVFPPFWDILTWIKLVDRGELPASVSIDEEGAEKVLSAEPLSQDDIVLFRIGYKYETGYQAEALVSRRTIVNVFRTAFTELLSTGFDPNEWYNHNDDDKDKKRLKIADDEWLGRTL